MAKQQLSPTGQNDLSAMMKDPRVVWFAEAVAAHKAGNDLEGMRGVIAATWDFWPEIADAASGRLHSAEWGIFEDRLKEAGRQSIFHPWVPAGAVCKRALAARAPDIRERERQQILKRLAD